MSAETSTTTTGAVPLAARPRGAPTAAARTGVPTRIDALDITKGLLVVLMVVYHSLNYSTNYRLAFRYLSFLPPSFILISGFLLSHVYLARRGVVDSALCLRLLSRGTKLIALFALLNVAGHFFRSRNYHGSLGGFDVLLANWPDIVFWGGSPLAAFDILLPIGYLLLLAPALLWLHRSNRVALPAIAIALLAGCSWLEMVAYYPPNLGFIAVGVLGIVLGALPSLEVSATARWAPAAVLFYGPLAYIGLKIGQPYLHQVVAAVVVLTALAGISTAWHSNGWFRQRLVTLGQYSLIGYVLQIAILQAYSHIIGRPEPASPKLAVMFAATLLLTGTAVEVTHFALGRYPSLRRAYRAILP